ncbi:hypothetical protein VCSRO184_3611 [Vibrio cholerae]|uniref:Uncharacterized protein n=2 Tax=Vibrio TaxID=662 RepID=A0A0Q0PEN8_VIBMT|nr:MULTISPECIES: hypothetical protein [Vibrio]EHH0849923.1 hypothetical protein [Vibrio vulnificus]EHK9068881.1 hypothetical protein [Vibrio vulnificus]EIO3984829.1 hypothetical protein [Vibrio vulnificus]EJL6481654.1 hypothetical protein [Vibrio cholerae]EKF9063420.1 hypothetical protein [Vibrio cholerae]
MIKVEYILDGQAGELELQTVTSFASKEEIVESWGNSLPLEFYLIEDALAILKPEVDAIPLPAACERGGERNFVTPQSHAQKFGFTKFVASIDGKKAHII